MAVAYDKLRVPDCNVVECLGQGGFGCVFKVWDRMERRPFAVKLIPLKSRPGSAEKAEIEVENLRKLKTVDGVINLHSSFHLKVDSEQQLKEFQKYLKGRCNCSLSFSTCGSSASSGGHESTVLATSSLLAIKMEYFEGYNLKEWLEKLCDPSQVSGQSELPWLQGEIRLLFFKIARILQDVHNLKFVHRDLKPQNILVQPPHRVGICDFGLSKDLSDLSLLVGPIDADPASNGISNCGSLWYRAPEVATVGHSFKSDVYSLGLIFLEMLTIYGNATDMEKIEIFRCHKDGGMHGKMKQFSPEAQLINDMLQKCPDNRCSLKEVVEHQLFNKSPFTCNICRTNIHGIQNFEQHLKGKKHLQAVENWRTSETKDPTFVCSVCNIVAPGKQNFHSHLRGKKHLRAIESWRTQIQQPIQSNSLCKGISRHVSLIENGAASFQGELQRTLSNSFAQ